MKSLLVLMLTLIAALDTGCTNVYVQTGSGSIERSVEVDANRTIKRTKDTP